MKIENRRNIKKRIRKKISGSAARPRMTVYKSLKNIYVQLVDDDKGHTVAAAQIKGNKNAQSAKELGIEIAAKAKEQGVSEVVFDRNGYQYHGVIKALADSAREGGLKL